MSGFATLEFIEWNDSRGRGTGESKLLEFTKVNGKKAAVAAARELLKKHADRYEIGSELQISVYPEIEWQPPEPDERFADE